MMNYPRWKWAQRVDPPVKPPTYEEFWAGAERSALFRLRELRAEVKAQRERLKHARTMRAGGTTPPPEPPQDDTREERS